MLQGVIWDVDGTLCDTLPLCLAAFRHVFRRHLGRDLDDAEIVAGFGATEAGLIRARVPDAWQEAEAEYLAEYARRHDAFARAFPGVPEVLAQLRARGVRQAVVTGKGPRSAAITLERLGLAGYFDRVEPGSPDGPVKPAGIRSVLHAWGLPAHAVAYVGDTPYDVRAARAAGVRAVRAAWSPTSGGMDHVAAADTHDAAGSSDTSAVPPDAVPDVVCTVPGELVAWSVGGTPPAGDASDPARWVAWGRELASMAQTGLAYARDPYDADRYRRMRDMALEMLAVGADAPLAVVRGLFDAETGHATPKVDVRAVVLREGRVLLVRERRDGRWTLPGGWADVGETPREAVAREVLEESGYRVRATRLLACYDKRVHPHPPQPFYVYKLFLECVLEGGAPAASDETDGADFFAPDALPPLSLDRVLPGQVARVVALAADPASAADVD